MNQEDVEQGFADAGWELDGSFYKHLIIGYVDDLSIIAYRQTWETEDPKLQLCDHETDLSYWVGEIPLAPCQLDTNADTNPHEQR